MIGPLRRPQLGAYPPGLFGLPNGLSFSVSIATQLPTHKRVFGGLHLIFFAKIGA